MPSDPAAAQKTADLLRGLWQRHLPETRARLDLLETVARASSANTLTEELRAEGIAVAHKLAGSLGMFGYPRGTELARTLEERLGAADGASDRTLEALAAEIRAVLELG